MRSLTAALLIFLAWIPAPAPAAEFPGYINYQGKLGNPAGNPLTGTYSFRFRFYTQVTGGTLLATDANFTGANAVTVTNGLYSVQIGSLTAGGLSEQVFHNAETWLEIDVSPGADFTGSETLAPRERLAAVPYAFRAVNAEKLGIGVNIATFTAEGNLTLPYGVSGGSFTATTYSSAPVMNVSTLAITSPDLNIYSNDGALLAQFDGSGANRGLRVNLGTFSGSLIGDLEVFDTGSPDLYFRRNDTAVNPKNTLGLLGFRDSDTSTNGSTLKATYEVTAGDVDWTSNTSMESVHRWGSSRFGGSISEFMVLTSTGLLVYGWPGAGYETLTACGTCTLQVVAPAGSGVSVTGGMEVSGPSTAAYFYGNGAGLTGIAAATGVAGLTSTQTFSGANTFTSLYGIHNSTYTSPPSATGTNTNWGGCNVALSTITMTSTMPGSTIKATLSDSVRMSSSGNYLNGGILMDGTVPYGADPTFPASFYDVADTLLHDIHVTKIWVNVSSGTHSFCYGYGSNVGGTWISEAKNATFLIEEVK